MKLSLNFGRGRGGGGGKFDFKQFLFQHAEKLLLALACMFLLLMVFSGYSNRNKIDASHDPQHLTRAVGDADSYINQARWDSVYAPKRDLIAARRQATELSTLAFVGFRCAREAPP